MHNQVVGTQTLLVAFVLPSRRRLGLPVIPRLIIDDVRSGRGVEFKE